MRKASLFLTCCIGIVCLFAVLYVGGCDTMSKSTEPATLQNVPEIGPLNRLSADARTAVKLECFYALNPAHNGTSTRSLNGWCVSDWDYLWSDQNAYNWIKSKTSPNTSSWYSTQDAQYIKDYWSNYGVTPKPISFYRDWVAYGQFGAYGRAGQCRPFVRYIYYRSGVYQSDWFPSYDQAIADYNQAPQRRTYTKPVSQLRVGDIIQTTWKNGHSAIVVAVLGGIEGQSVTSVDVVDANFIGGDGQEIIGRHIISRITSGSGNGSLSDLDSYLAIDLVKLGGR